MVDPISPAAAAQNLAALINRLESPANKDPAAEARNALPVGQAANVNAGVDIRESFVPARAEPPEATDNAPVSNERRVRQPYLPTGGSEEAAPAAGDGASEDAAEAVRLQNSVSASTGATESVQSRVQKLYDLAE